MTPGEPLVLHVAMKPISTLMSPLRTVDLASGAPAQAQSERSDVTAVPAMGVIAEAMIALMLAQAMLEKFGGDSLGEMKRNFQGYLAQVGARIPKGGAGAGPRSRACSRPRNAARSSSISARVPTPRLSARCPREPGRC